VSLATVEGVHSMVSPKQKTEGVAGAAKQAESAFEELLLGYYTRIVGVLFRLVGDRSRAEELANDVFWKLYRQPLVPNPEGNLGGWLYRTACNLGIDALRAAARRQRYEHAAGRLMLEAGAPADPLDDVLREEKRGRVRAILASLMPAQAQILILRSSGLSYKELAETLGVKLGSVGTMLVRAEAELRKRYLEMHGDEEEL